MSDLIVISDIGLDHDDEFALCLLAGLVEKGDCQLSTVVANYNPALQRARLAKGALQVLNLGQVPVGCGFEIDNKHSVREYEFKANYLASSTQIEKDGQKLLVDCLKQAADKSIDLVCISAMSDANYLLQQNKQLFKDKVRQVNIMGGIDLEQSRFIKDDSKIVADTSSNNQFDREAANHFYQSLFELEIPVLIVNRKAVYQIGITPEKIEQWARGGHPIAQRLYQEQASAMNAWWYSANLDLNDPARGPLAPRFNRAWFLETFCDLSTSDRAGDEPIWDLVKRVFLYDPLTVLACVFHEKELFQQMFKPEQVANFQIISEEDTVVSQQVIREQLDRYLDQAFLN